VFESFGEIGKIIFAKAIDYYEKNAEGY